MKEDNLDKLIKLGLVIELIAKSKEIVQEEGLCGGYRGYVDDLLGSIEGELCNEFEVLKNTTTE